ncbi:MULTISPECIES: LysR family transcriptional regulator [unclassified Breznakia]|uniref:LysR family transcriptional regulator n=1 Tax=unclassified Breznakia TaxID=2623764 RepID=UPI0024751BE3|nr:MULTISPECIES: LysR family transcriptional regulator [unclassified Breznakia]MDH6365903.1 LysR family transcriptional activator of glutamate synthase operon [Breznakia sp. PH1-1]MDH6403165.1 LysR family transcriptional activator of glutamate synthase operon [Breznakia sp. PF1-11]MDH6410874.1 LysR family transcriptional activator of glutamate synthase operon [Breznakia sp. PFB1-11]MDH6413069.1 LysR family transcriptional activator of glutamate synthase operon [Breznakia sp. PFB1-14]MDH6415437
MNLNQFQYVAKLAETKNYTKAAELLYITQPTLSQQIKKLEDELGVKLFNRKKKQEVTLTKAGVEFLYYANKIQIELSRMKVALGTHKADYEGKLHIGLVNAFGHGELYRHMMKYSESSPNVKVDFHIDNSPELIRKMVKGDLDIIFITTNFFDRIVTDDLALASIYSSNIAVAVNKDHTLANLKEIHPSDLHLQNVLLVSNKSSVYNQITTSFKDANAKPNIIGESSQEDVIKDVAASGMGIGFLTDSYNDELQDSAIKLIPYVPAIERTVNICTLKESLKSKLIADFYQYTIDAFEINKALED